MTTPSARAVLQSTDVAQSTGGGRCSRSRARVFNLVGIQELVLFGTPEYEWLVGQIFKLKAESLFQFNNSNINYY